MARFNSALRAHPCARGLRRASHFHPSLPLPSSSTSTSTSPSGPAVPFLFFLRVSVPAWLILEGLSSGDGGGDRHLVDLHLADPVLFDVHHGQPMAAEVDELPSPRD